MQNFLIFRGRLQQSMLLTIVHFFMRLQTGSKKMRGREKWCLCAKDKLPPAQVCRWQTCVKHSSGTLRHYDTAFPRSLRTHRRDICAAYEFCRIYALSFEKGVLLRDAELSQGKSGENIVRVGILKCIAGFLATLMQRKRLATEGYPFSRSENERE